jgi:hypothetical protein
VTLPFGRAPEPTYRLIPSKFPPIGLFDTVATAADLDAVLDLVGWTNDRLVAERIALLPRSDWVYGRPNASIVMAAFLHVAPGGMRFNSGDLGAWYAAAELATAAAEVAHHLRREAVATSVPAMVRTYRCYLATLDGDPVDTRGAEDTLPGVFAPDSYAASQPFGEGIRAAGHAGILYASLRKANGLNIVGYRPRGVLDVRQGDHFEISVRALDRRIEVRSLRRA